MKKAFTLIELLVVVAIVATLLALLMPAVSRAKVSSARAISAHSLMQLNVAGRLYLNDHDNYFWPYEQIVPGKGAQWWFGFETSASLKAPEGQRTCDYSQGPLGPYAITAGGVKEDPAFLQYPHLKLKYQDGNYGYGYNDLLATDLTKGTAASHPAHNALQVTHPSQLIVFATCAQVNTFELPASPGNPMIEDFYMVDNTQVTAHFRHGNQALAAFLDGSVQSLSMATDMQPGTQDMRMPSANIGRFKDTYMTQPGW
jgi:prepilin-type N-terminal cleavage/methylation domain-containing protein/prepilin-type processing-associated H-X9-DG protein